MAGAEHRELSQRPAVHADRGPRCGQYRPRAGSVPTRSDPASWRSPTLDAWFDKTAFVVPAVYIRRTERGVLRGDHQWNVDFSIFKRFRFNGSKSIEFRAEAFNLLNSVYFDLPNTAIDTAAGGRVTSDVEPGTANPARGEVHILTSPRIATKARR